MRLEEFEFSEKIVGCPACSAKRCEFAFSSVDDDWSIAGFPLDHCLECGTHFVNPRPTDASLGRFYSGIPDSRSSYLESSARYYLNPKRREEMKKDYLDPLLRKTRSGHLLDFAACTGWFMRLCQDYGFTADGLEFNHKAVETGQTLLGLTTLRQGDHTNLTDSDKYDVLVGHAIIEHLTDPEAFLTRALNSLKPGGLLYLSYPTCDTPMFTLFREFGYYIMAPYHLTHFSTRGMRSLVTRVGFTDVEFERVKESGMWGHAIAHRNGLLDRYRAWREERSFIDYDIKVDGFIDNLVNQLGLSPVQLLFARRPDQTPG